MGNKGGSMNWSRPRVRRRSRLGSTSSAALNDVFFSVDSCDKETFVTPKTGEEIQSSEQLEGSPDVHSSKPRTLSLMASDGSEFKVTSLPITFRWEGRLTTKEVFLCGSFNDWYPLEMERYPGQQDFTLMVSLAEGKHQYYYMVDGVWKHDPSATTLPLVPGSELLLNGIDVRMQDFRVFDALALDDLKLDEVQTDHSSWADSDSEYGQVPNYDPDVWDDEREIQPATIPPYLMELNLNKCGLAHPRSHPCSRGPACEPEQDVPEPSHAMLNHLYSLSLKEGVMVLGTSVRFRQKKVSTIYYKSMDNN